MNATGMGAAAIFGLTMGIGIGWLINRKTDKEAEDFVDGLREETEMQDISTYWPEVPPMRPMELVEALMEDPAESEAPEDDEPEEDEEDVFDEEAERIASAYRQEHMTTGEPYVIDESFFFAQDAGYQQQTLTYSEGEMLLRDEDEQIIMDVAKCVGWEALEKFGEGSSDPNTVYVRNDRLMIDYEIIREE